MQAVSQALTLTAAAFLPGPSIFSENLCVYRKSDADLQAALLDPRWSAQYINGPGGALIFDPAFFVRDNVHEWALQTLAGGVAVIEQLHAKHIKVRCTYKAFTGILCELQLLL